MVTVTEYFTLVIVSFLVGYTIAKSRNIVSLIFMVVAGLNSIFTSHLYKVVDGTFDSLTYLATIIGLVVVGVIIGSNSPDNWELNNTQTIPTEQVTEVSEQVTEVPKN